MKEASPHRDREGRAHVARRDHRARVRHPRHRRLRGRDQDAEAAARGDGLVRRGRRRRSSIDGIASRSRSRRSTSTQTTLLETKIKLNVGFPAKALRTPAALRRRRPRAHRVHPHVRGRHPPARAPLPRGAGRLPRDRQALARARGLRGAARAGAAEELTGSLGAIDRRTPGYADKRQFFVDGLKYGVGLICAAFYPRPVLVRLSDLKSNEYRELLGGRLFEPVEENPMIAWRGASRYVDPRFLPAFEMECDALRSVAQATWASTTCSSWCPFCRTPEEGAEVAPAARRARPRARDRTCRSTSWSSCRAT